ncbi:hypothetical protein ScalyP_jg481 [Parmales sp. scaly parma]|nr:hypothetical protein ScalyP_jg481 [Parmales sp. scaly parma]
MLLTVSTPTKPQQQYQNEIVSFNIETFKSHNAGCNAENWNDQDQSPMSDPATFAPQLLNISNWVESFQMVGASSAVLTAKHVCGFMLWPTETVFDDGTPYNYHSPRDHLVTEEEYERIAGDQLAELWSNYGDLDEIWFDGGYEKDAEI